MLKQRLDHHVQDDGLATMFEQAEPLVQGFPVTAGDQLGGGGLAVAAMMRTVAAMFATVVCAIAAIFATV